MVEFKTSDSIVTVIAGIDGSVPPNNIQKDIREAVNIKVNRAHPDFTAGRDSVDLNTIENPSPEQREVLGGAVLYVMQFDVNLGDRDVDQDVLNAAHNEVIDKLNELGFNISGTSVVWEGRLR